MRPARGRRLKCASLLVVWGLAACPARALARDRISYVVGRVGYFRLKDLDTGSLNVGLQGGVYFAPRVAVEASVDYHTADFDAYGRETYAFQASAHVYPFTARHAFRPYAVAGAGFYWNYYQPVDPSRRSRTVATMPDTKPASDSTSSWRNRAPSRPPARRTARSG